MDKPVTDNPWGALRQLTAARIALGRSGISQPTSPQLAFQLAHARARDAVHLALDPVAVGEALHAASGLPFVSVHSAAANRHVYLQRPDLGRRLDDGSRDRLTGVVATGVAATATASASAVVGAPRYDLALVVADGLSALAIEQNAAPFIHTLMARLSGEQWRLAPLTIVQQGRVAIGDEIGHFLGAQAVVVLIGERPGLSSPDSMGLYLTWAPRPGLTDASRNCISNVRPNGLTYDAAAFKLHYLLSEARRRQLSGVALKDETSSDSANLEAPRRNFLLE
jgi:ethanolamine ammonia-lyase small subunit